MEVGAVGAGVADGASVDGADAADASDAAAEIGPSDGRGGADGSADAAEAEAGSLLPWSAIRPCSVYTKVFNQTATLASDGKTFAMGGGAPALVDATTGQQIGAPLAGLFGPANSVAFSPDGRLLAASSQGGGLYDPPVDGDLLVAWHLPERSVAWRLALPLGQSQVAFSPDGKLLAVASYDKSVRLVDAATGKLVSTYTEHSTGVSSVAFSPDGTLVASGAYAEVRVWRVTDLVTTRTLASSNVTVTSLAFSPDGTQLLGGFRWRLSDGTKLEPLSGLDGAVAFAPDGKTFFGGGLFRTSDGASLQVGPIQGDVPPLGVGSNQCAVYTADSSRIFLLPASNRPFFWTLDTNTGQDVSGFQPRFGVVTPKGSVSPDGTRLLIGGQAYALATGDLISSVCSATDDDSPNAYSPDGTLVACPGGAGIDLVPASGGNATGSLPLPATKINAIAFSPDGTLLASGSDDHRVRIWDVAQQSLVRTLGSVIDGHLGPVIEVSWSPDGKSLVSTGGTNDEQSIVWRVADGTILHTFTASAGVVGAAFSPSAATPEIVTNTNISHVGDGGFAYSTGLSTLWDATTFQSMRAYSGHRSAIAAFPAFSADGALVATPNNVEVPILSTADAELVAMPTFPNLGGSVVFAADGVVIFGVQGAVYWCRP